MTRRELAERADEVAEVLAGFEGADRDDEGSVADRRGHGRGHLRGVAERGDPERDHDETARGAQPHAVDLLDLVGHELRPRVQRRTARDRPADDRIERTHLGRAELRIANERAVVDADHLREPGRGCEVVRRVDDLRRREPAVDARCFGSHPGA